MSSETIQTSGVASRYADAFFELMAGNKALDVAEKDLNALKSAIADNTELRDFLKSPIYTQQDQTSAITTIAEKAGFHDLTRNYLVLITQNRRLFALEDIIRAFNAKLADHRGEVSAEAISAMTLNDEQTRRLRVEIETIVGKAVNLKTRVDPTLLGGLIVKVGSTMIDSSLKTKLNRIQSVMKEA